MKKTLFLACFLCAKVACAQVTITGHVVQFGEKIALSYWENFHFVSDTIQLDKSNRFKKTYSFTAPTYIRMETIDQQSFTPFFLIFPNGQLYIEKTQAGITLNGDQKRYNDFVIRLNEDVTKKFDLNTVDYNLITQYMLDRSDGFFAGFNDINKATIKDLNTLNILAGYKLYPLLKRYNQDTSKMRVIINALKNKSDLQRDTIVAKYLDRLNFDNEDLQYASTASLSMFNNLIRILRYGGINNDTALYELDEYVVENKIIKNIFKETPFRTRLMGYNLNHRIESYIEYPTRLAGTEDFIAAYKKEKFADPFIPAIENAYARQKASLATHATGAKAPAFKLPNAQGKLVSLADFKGKVVYIDLWASWCSPCLAEMPYLNKLKKKFEGKDVVILSISIDTERNRWLKKIADMGLDGVQLIDSSGSMNSKIAKDYKAVGVPQYILIDKKGRIASSFAPRPSYESVIAREINKLLEY